MPPNVREWQLKNWLKDKMKIVTAAEAEAEKIAPWWDRAAEAIVDGLADLQELKALPSN